MYYHEEIASVYMIRCLFDTMGTPVVIYLVYEMRKGQSVVTLIIG